LIKFLDGLVSGTGEREETDWKMETSLHKESQIHSGFIAVEVAAVALCTRALTGSWKEGSEELQ
jgi:hypothetical protein